MVQKIQLQKIEVDYKIYPRFKSNWITVLKYADALQSGAKFPPIIVALHKNRFILIDGLHRLEAYKKNKLKEIECLILTGLNDKELYLEAVKANTTHGLQYSAGELTKIVLTLQHMKLSPIQISDMIKMPVSKIQPYLAKRTITTMRAGKPETTVLKKELRHLGGSVTQIQNLEEIQQNYSGRTQEKLLDEVVSLLENKLIDIQNKKVTTRLLIIHELIERYDILKQEVKKKRDILHT